MMNFARNFKFADYRLQKGMVIKKNKRRFNGLGRDRK